MFKRMMSQLKGQIEFFCFHQRDVVVLELLWDQVRSKNKRLTKEERRERMIVMINRIADAEG